MGFIGVINLKRVITIITLYPYSWYIGARTLCEWSHVSSNCHLMVWLGGLRPGGLDSWEKMIVTYGYPDSNPKPLGTKPPVNPLADTPLKKNNMEHNHSHGGLVPIMFEFLNG